MIEGEKLKNMIKSCKKFIKKIQEHKFYLIEIKVNKKRYGPTILKKIPQWLELSCLLLNYFSNILKPKNMYIC